MLGENKIDKLRKLQLYVSAFEFEKMSKPVYESCIEKIEGKLYRVFTIFGNSVIQNF